MINWFGPTPWGQLCMDTPRCEPPVGSPCVWCGEAIADHDSGLTLPSLSDTGLGVVAYHQNCHLRQVVGSVGHQRRRCSCYGGADEDPPELTRRQAADEAVIEFARRIGERG